MIAVLNAAISIYFYLRIVVAMFMRERHGKDGIGPVAGRDGRHGRRLRFHDVDRALSRSVHRDGPPRAGVVEENGARPVMLIRDRKRRREYSLSSDPGFFPYFFIFENISESTFCPARLYFTNRNPLASYAYSMPEVLKFVSDISSIPKVLRM